MAEQNRDEIDYVAPSDTTNRSNLSNEDNLISREEMIGYQSQEQRTRERQNGSFLQLNIHAPELHTQQNVSYLQLNDCDNQNNLQSLYSNVRNQTENHISQRLLYNSEQRRNQIDRVNDNATTDDRFTSPPEENRGHQRNLGQDCLTEVNGNNEAIPAEQIGTHDSEGACCLELLPAQQGCVTFDSVDTTRFSHRMDDDELYPPLSSSFSANPNVREQSLVEYNGVPIFAPSGSRKEFRLNEETFSEFSEPLLYPLVPSQGNGPIVCRELKKIFHDTCGVLCFLVPVCLWLQFPLNEERFASSEERIYHVLIEISRLFNAGNFGMVIDEWSRRLDLCFNAELRTATELMNIDLAAPQLESAASPFTMNIHRGCTNAACSRSRTGPYSCSCMKLNTSRILVEPTFKNLVDLYLNNLKCCSQCTLFCQPLPHLIFFNMIDVTSVVTSSREIPDSLQILGKSYKRLVITFYRNGHLTAVMWCEQLNRNVYYDCNETRDDYSDLGLLREFSSDPGNSIIQMVVYVLQER